MGKKSKHKHYDDPSAFYHRWPEIREVDVASGMRLLTNSERSYRMGKVLATVVPPTKEHGYFMSVRCKDRYPTWDEIVWLRYNLIPDAAQMAMLLPNLDRYINQESTAYKYVFTMEQTSWVLNPEPACPCGGAVKLETVVVALGRFRCATCEAVQEIDLLTWNEQHGNGFAGADKADSDA